MNFYINANGINNETASPKPNDIEVDKCIKYLSNINERDKYMKVSSYALKTSIEKIEGYVSNGAFITALDRLNLNYKRCSYDSLNVFVKFNTEDLEKAILEERLKNLSQNKKLNKFHCILDKSRSVGYCTNIKDLYSFLIKETNLEFTKEELYITLTKIELIRFNYKEFLINEFLDSIKVNISLKKLKRALS
jgi:hypothetical protein